MSEKTFSPIEEIIEDVRRGRIVILTDDEDRENEGDFVIAAEKVTPEAINFMTKYGRGLVCMPITEEWADHLGLPLMTSDNKSRFGTAFTVSIEAAEGVTTGISAHDRAHTIRTAIADEARPEDLVRPGHIFPLRAKRGGVLVRTGQTEGAVDLARLAGLKAAGVVCEIMSDDGTMARLPELKKLAAEHSLKICSVAQIIEYRRRTEKLIERALTIDLPTLYGDFKLTVYRSDVDKEPHLALYKGFDLRENGTAEPLDEPILVRVHSECLTGDILGSLRCDCGPQLATALRMIEREGKGVLVYMRQEGRGIGLYNKLCAYELQQKKGLDTVEANLALGFKDDLRDYGIGAQILADLGVRKMRVMTNNPKKIIGLSSYGLEVIERVPIEIRASDENRDYISCKRAKMGHIINDI